MTISRHVRPCPLNVAPSELRPILPTPSPLHFTRRSPLAPCRAGRIDGRRQDGTRRPELRRRRRRFGGGGKRREGRRKSGGKRRRGRGEESGEEGDFVENMMAVCCRRRCLQKKPLASGQKMRDERTRRGRESLAHHYVPAMKSDVSPALKAVGSHPTSERERERERESEEGKDRSDSSDRACREEFCEARILRYT